MTSLQPSRGRTGRRPGKPATREHVLEVANAVFRRDGYEDASVRAIAREAGVDPALVRRYFGDKRDLFVRATLSGVDPSPLIEVVASGTPHDLGARIVEMACRLWESPLGQQLIEVVRSDPRRLPLLAGFMRGPIVVAAMNLLHLPRREAELKASLLQALMMGLLEARYLVKVEPLASLEREEVVRLWGPIMQYAALGSRLHP